MANKKTDNAAIDAMDAMTARAREIQKIGADFRAAIAGMKKAPTPAEMRKMEADVRAVMADMKKRNKK